LCYIFSKFIDKASSPRPPLLRLIRLRPQRGRPATAFFFFKFYYL
jgi:hypothetical protein